MKKFARFIFAAICLAMIVCAIAVVSGAAGTVGLPEAQSESEVAEPTAYTVIKKWDFNSGTVSGSILSPVHKSTKNEEPAVLQSSSSVVTTAKDTTAG